MAQNALPPAQLLFEQLDGCGRNPGPAKRVVVDVSAVALKQDQVGHEAVFALVDGNAEPMALAYHRLDLQQQFPPDCKQTSADAAHAASPVLRNLIEVKRGVVDKRLD